MVSVTIVDIPNVSDNVQQFQFIQEEQGKLELKIVKRKSFSGIDMQKIRQKLKDKFGDDMDVDISFVDSIASKSKHSAKIPTISP